MVVENIEIESLYKAGIFVLVLVLAWFIRDQISFHIFQRIYAWNVNSNTSCYNDILRKEKIRVFQFLHEHKERINQNLAILDVGSGPAVNLPFFPENTKLVCLDPNPHNAGYINDNLKKYDNVIESDIIQGYAEKMPLESERFDAVVCSLILCVVEDIGKSLEEIKRVLKPGGKLVFLEHITVANKWSWTFVLQCARIPLVRLLYGCHITRDTAKSLQTAGFSEVHLEYVNPEAVSLDFKRCIIGVATK